MVKSTLEKDNERTCSKLLRGLRPGYVPRCKSTAWRHTIHPRPEGLVRLQPPIKVNHRVLATCLRVLRNRTTIMPVITGEGHSFPWSATATRTMQGRSNRLIDLSSIYQPRPTASQRTVETIASRLPRVHHYKMALS